MLTTVLVTLVLSGSAQPAMKTLGPETITLKVGHKFSTAEAHVRVQMLLDYWKSRFGVSQRWNGERVWVSGSIVGVDFDAILEVSDGQVQCESTDPGGMWRNFARDYVSRKLHKYLHPKYQEL
ncbi:MAG: hypothetical protein H6Q89_296 [Myxococcaceae bacterium]|nr:hypothetical protein [Myxococcaceae bacterium]